MITLLSAAAVCSISAGVGAAPENAARFVYVEDTSRLIHVERPLAMLVGRFTADGEFVPAKVIDMSTGWAEYSGPPMHDANISERDRVDPKTRTERVYELRSGVLVPGELGEFGNFIPTIGGKIIGFRDYKYSKEAPRIWNLPGRFERRDQPPK
jgi:hypothetical protein